MDAHAKSLDFFNSTNITLYEFNIGSIKEPDRWNSSNNYLPFNMLYYVVRGRIEIKTKLKTTVLLPNHAYLIPAHKTYDLQCMEPTTLLYVHFSYQLTNGSDLFDSLVDCISIPLKPFEHMLDFFQPSDLKAHDIMSLKSLLYSLIGQVMESHNITYELAVPTYSELILHALQYINQNLSAKLQVSEIAKNLNYNPNYLSKKFYEECNVTIKKHISTLLYQKALLLLTMENMTIKEVAEQLKFSDPYYFSRFFKKYHLASPDYFTRKWKARKIPSI